MRIAICEDNKEHAEILKNMIGHWAEQEKFKVDIGYYQSAEEFLFYMKEDSRYDLAFLDIQLEKMNGIQLARMIRKEDRTIILVFTTGVKNYTLSGYEVSAFRYLIKPLQEQDIMSTLTKANRLIEENKKNAIIITYNDELCRIFKNDIYYIETDNHHIILHMENEQLRFKARLKEFEKQFQEPQFCKCHRSFIVNLHHVSKISREKVEIESGREVPVSRARWDNLNRCYLAYYTIR